MVLVLVLIFSLVPVMRLKDYLFEGDIKLKLRELQLKIQSFDFSSLGSLSFRQVLYYLKVFVNWLIRETDKNVTPLKTYPTYLK